jgi:hypothetical protein
VYPFLFAAFFSASVNLYVIQRIGLDRLIVSTVHSSTAIDHDTVVQNALARRNTILAIQAFSILVNSFVMALVVSKVLWLILTLLGRDVAFKQVLAVVTHVSLLTVSIRQMMLALTTTLVRDPGTINLRNPLATNIGFFLPSVSATAGRILTSIDVITFANIALLTLGLTKVCAHLSRKTAALAVMIPWMIYVGATTWIPSIQP